MQSLINLHSNRTSMYELPTKFHAENPSSSTVEIYFKCWVTLNGEFKKKGMQLNDSSVCCIRMCILWSLGWKVIPSCSSANVWPSFILKLHCLQLWKLCATYYYSLSTSHLVQTVHWHVYGDLVLEKFTLCF